MLRPHPLSLALIATLSVTALPLHAADAGSAKADDPVELDRIEVTGSATPRHGLALEASAETASTLGLTLRQLPFSVSVIGRDDLALRGLRTPLEALVTSVGVTGGILPGSIPRFSTRGFTENNLTLLRDGIRQNTMAQSSRPVDAFMLERIEVLKGPSSMMHGEGAVAGAINLVSRAPSFTPQRELQLSAGEDGRWQLGGSIAGPFADERAAYRFSASRSASGDAGIARSGTELASVAAGATMLLGEALTASVQIDAQDEAIDSWFGLPVIYDAAINTLTGLPRTTGPANPATDRLLNPRIEPSTRRFNYNLRDSFTDGRNTFARFGLEWRGDGVSAKAALFHASHFLDWRNSENYVWNPSTRLVQRDLFYIHRNDDLVGARLQLGWDTTLAGRRLQASVGLDASHNDLFRGTRAPGALPVAVFNVPLGSPDLGSTPAAFARFVPQARATVDTVAPFVEAAWDVSDRVKLIGGLRHDRLDVDRNDLINPAASVNQNYAPTTGRFGATFAVTPGAQLYASVATSADPVQQFVSINTAQAALSLQTGRQLEAGWKQSLADGRFEWTAAAYRIEKRDLLTTSIINGLSVAQAVGQQSSKGVELAAHWRPDARFDLGANVAYTAARYDDFAETVANPRAGQPGEPATVLVDRSGLTPPNVPRWTANLSAVYRPADAWEIGAVARHVGARQANNANLIEVPGFTVLDASVAWTQGRWRYALFGRNLGDRLYADWAINQGLQQRVGDRRAFELVALYRF